MVYGGILNFRVEAMPSRISGACNACRAKKQKAR
jgi:hypothetical protein